MHQFTKLFLTSLALTLGGCDTGSGDDFGAGATAFRPFGSYRLNTSFIGGHDYAHLNLKGKVQNFVRLKQVCLDGKHGLCLYPSKDLLWVEAGQIMGERNGKVFQGKDFVNSYWHLELDHNRDGFMDSTIEAVILDARANATAQTGAGYWDYFWGYDSKTATGLVTKYIEQNPKPTPMCEVDMDSGSLGSIALGDTSIDTSSATDGVVKKVQHSMFIACHSGATGKAPTWGYVLHEMGHAAYTNVIRVIRADYCGNGKSWTVLGEAVAVTDSKGINDEYDPNLKLEGLASFEKGWLCIHAPRAAALEDVLGACEIKECKGDAPLGEMGSELMTQLP